MLDRNAASKLIPYAEQFEIYNDIYNVMAGTEKTKKSEEQKELKANIPSEEAKKSKLSKEAKTTREIEKANNSLIQKLITYPIFIGKKLDFSFEQLRSERRPHSAGIAAGQGILLALHNILIVLDRNFANQIKSLLGAKKSDDTTQINYYITMINARREQLLKYKEIVELSGRNDGTVALCNIVDITKSQLVSAPFGTSQMASNLRVNTNMANALAPIVAACNKLKESKTSAESKLKPEIREPTPSIIPATPHRNQGYSMRGALAGLGISVGIAVVHLSTGGAPLIVYIGYAVGTVVFTAFSSWLGGRIRSSASLGERQDSNNDQGHNNTQTDDIDTLSLDSSYTRPMRQIAASSGESAEESKRSTSRRDPQSGPTTPTQLPRSAPSTAARDRSSTQQQPASEPRQRERKAR